MNRFAQKLQDLKDHGRYRSLNLPCGVDLTSNDYLGLSNHPKLKQAALTAIESGIDFGVGGSRLLRGHTESYEALETFSADFFGFERALFFATGYQANMAIFSSLPSRHDMVLFDSLIHASARDGIQNAHAKGIKIPHNDLNAYEDALKRARDSAEQIWIAVESLYSMDGDLAPLAELYDLAQRFDAILVVDEAHATGVMGEDGKGLCDSLPHENLITLHTCGKALGVAGGLVCASNEIIETLINTARPFIYSTAPPPLQALLVQKSLEIVGSQDGKNRREQLHNLANHVQKKLSGPGTHIVPIIIGDDKKALEVANALQNSNYDIRAIRPPTVPENTARLRLSLSATLSEKILDDFFDHLMPLIQKRAA